MTKIGARVIVTPHDVPPQTIAHKNLPLPYLWPAEALQARAAAPGETTAAIADAGKAAGGLEQVSLTAAPVEAKGLNPLEYAQNMKRQANEKARLAAKSMKAAHIEGVRKGAELRMAHRRLNAAKKSASENAADRLAAAMRKLSKVDDEDFVQAGEGIAALKAALGEAKRREDEARAAILAEDALNASRREAQDARSAGKAAAAALTEASRRLRPLSVFISRKTGRLYVRQELATAFRCAGRHPQFGAPDRHPCLYWHPCGGERPRPDVVGAVHAARGARRTQTAARLPQRGARARRCPRAGVAARNRPGRPRPPHHPRGRGAPHGRACPGSARRSSSPITASAARRARRRISSS